MLNFFTTVNAFFFPLSAVLEQNARKKGNVSCREYYCYKAQMRDGDCSYILHAGRLGHQYIIDMYIKLETSRLDYYRKEQTQQDLRTESYQGIVDTLCADGYTIASDVGQKVILPSSFIGGPRDMRKRYVNAMSLVQRFGKPDLFLTMTCNPAWEEIAANLLPGQKPHDRPDLTTRVFKAKLEELKHDIVKRQIFGPVAAYVYTVEYQKRGLPHCHWVIILQATHKIMSSQIYDEIISAEIPDNSHPFLKSYVVRHMMHGPCGVDNPKNSCMSKDKCKNHYPKDFSEITSNGENSYPSYRRRNDGKQVTVRNKPLDNRHVVPYSPFLLAKFDCHINVEICADVKLVKYLYKYIHKGHDKLAYQVVPAVSTECQDEIHAYQNGRWICAPEAYWRIYSFPMSDMHPAVIVLPVHLPNHQPLRFGKNQSLQQVLANPYSGITMLTEFFAMNASNKDAQRLNLLYKEFPEFFVWESTERHWKIRKKQVVIGRLCTVSPLEGERYFERLLLVNVRCPKSFNDLMTVGGKKFDTFREAAVSRGLLHSNKYVDTCLAEAALFQAPSCLRILFAMLLIYAVTSDLQVLWDKYYYSLSEDFASNARFTKKEVLEKTVDAIDMILTSMDKCIADFPIRFHVDYSVHIDRLSRDYRYESLMRVSEIDKASINQLNDEQQQVYNTIVARLHVGQGGVFFLDGPGGTGKTFLYRALLAYVRSRGNIALAVATSGVAASLLPGGRTAHSRFKLPLDVDDVCAARISKQTSLAKMITESKMIVWDEASMANKHTIEALHHLLCDLCDKVQPFGGKCVLFGGDFRQTLPIVTRGSRDSMIKASIVSSTLWPSVQKLHLTKNMRAQKDLPFTDFLLRIGNGNEPFLFDDNVQIPANMLIHFDNDVDSLNRLIDTVYPGLRTFKEDPHSLVSRAILTTKNDCVQELNDFLIEQFPGDLKEYVSFNATDDTFQQGEYEDYLNSLSASGLPPHILRLKKNCPIMLLRNLNPIQGLCNGTRLICREMGDNFIQAEIAVGDFKGDLVFIPRIPLESSDRLKCPIPFKRMQIPVKPCFVMTINKSQGQTLDFVGIYLREPVFSHGQLYVALSRARNADSVKILIHPDVKKKGPVNYTKNVVYHEIFDLAQG